MRRYPHILRRDGLYSSAWSLKGPIMDGRFTAPTRHAPGQYHSAALRIRYEILPERRVAVRFQTPRLARGGHRIMGEARLGVGVEVRSTGTDEAPTRFVVKRGGLFGGRTRLVARDGVVTAAFRRDDDRLDVDLNADACRWTGAPADVEEERTRRVLESALAMYLATVIEAARREDVPTVPERAPRPHEPPAVVTRLLRRVARQGGADPAKGREGRGSDAPST